MFYVMPALHSTSYDKFSKTPKVYYCRTEYLKTLLSLIDNEWNELNHDIRSSSSEGVFCNASLTFVSLLQVKPRVFMCSLD